MKRITRQQLRKFKREIEKRLSRKQWDEQTIPMFKAGNIQYEYAGRARGLCCGGIGVLALLVKELGLAEAIDSSLHLLKRHLPYYDSDHVLNIAYNILCGGRCLDDIERLRNDAVYLDAVGADRIPDPTTAGDYCRRFTPADVLALMEAINDVRLLVWQMQPESFLDEAIIDVDGTLVTTTGECKEGMDYSYKKVWGYHPLVVTLANTGEVLYVVNRSGSRPSHEGMAEWLTRAIDLCRRAGFKKITIRGDTDFGLTRHFDEWNELGVRFVFGMDVRNAYVHAVESLSKKAWECLERRTKHTVKTEPRGRPDNVKQRLVIEREFTDICLNSEDVASFDREFQQCQYDYRMIALRKNLSYKQGGEVLFDNIRYFMYVTNDDTLDPEDVVFLSNDRCNQENLIEQLKNGVRALHSPVDNLDSNWAYMVMASLAWTLKAWFGLVLPENGHAPERRTAEKKSILKMEFRTFLHAFMMLPAQLVKTGRRLVFRLLSWNRHHEVLFRVIDRLHQRRLC